MDLFGDSLKHYRFKDISITSAKKPFSTHLIWEHSTYGLVMVDSTDQTVLLISTDKGANWSSIDLSDNTNSYKIQAGWLDGNDLWLAMCDNDGTADDFEVCFIELDDSNDCNPVAVSAGADADTVYVYDIFKLGSDFYVHNKERRGGVNYFQVIWDVDADPFVEKDTRVAVPTATWTHSVVIGTSAFFLRDQPTTPSVIVQHYDSTIPDIVGIVGEANWSLSADANYKGLSYDGSDNIMGVVNKDADSKNYLWIYNITGEFITIGAEYNISLMLDRNNSATVPNELEKAFGVSGVSDKIVYEIKPRRGGIVQLQDLSGQLSGSIVAITDNYLFADDDGGTWDMFEFTDITSEISRISYTNGIIGIPQRGTFIVHPDFAHNWNKEDSIKIYDDNDVLEFWGKIEEKNRDSRGRYHFPIDAFSNEVYRSTYEKVYSGDDLDTKQKDIIDNGCNFCYRSSSIVGTTTNFDYDYKRAIAYLFYLGRFLERQVPYVEPDGKVWTKAHDGLAKNPLIYPATYDFKDDADGAEPAGWTSNNGADCTTIIIASLDGHRKVLQINDPNGATRASIDAPFTQGLNTEFEFFFTKSSVAGNTTFQFYLFEDATVIIHWAFISNDLDEESGGFASIKDDFLVANTLSHFRLVLNDTANTYDVYIDGILEGVGIAYKNNSTSGINKLRFFSDNADLGYSGYVDAVGVSTDPDYDIGDNEVAWDLTSNTENVFFIDIPNIGERQTGFFDGNTGITRTNVRYLNNTVSTRPVAATRDPIEQLKGIIPLKEFRDPRIEGATEADQLGDNLYGIFSIDTIFLALFVQGQGFLQPGKTIDLRNTGQIAVSQDDFVILQYTRDPKNDRYFNMILSDNIIFSSEFKSFNDTTPKQIHTSIVQTFENQNDINAHLTREGGLALRLTNKTGGASVKGTIVEAHAATDNAFRVCDADSVESFGVVYEDGIADGSECLVVVGGRCQVLLKDATLSTRNNWVKVSDVAGRADATGASPAAAPTHFKEIGHCIESKGADTDVLAYMMLHFL